MPKIVNAVLLLVAGLAVLGAAGSARADQAPWLHADWPVRRVVKAEAQVAEGAAAKPDRDHVGVVEFYHGGRMADDGRDIRVAVQGRRTTPHHVMQIGPGDFVRVAFALVPGRSKYYVYCGNPEAPRPTAAEPWKPRRGLRLAVREWVGGPLSKLQEVGRRWGKGRPVGEDFVSTIHFGHNPFAPASTPAVFRFTGFLKTQPGAYEVAITSHGPSWLYVDGKEVVAWPGGHGATREARHTGKVTLGEGVHELAYWYVNHGGDAVAVAAWRKAGGDGRFRPIPKEAFLPVARAELLEKDVRGATAVADFHLVHAGETWWPDHYAVRYTFKNLSQGIHPRRGGGFIWDFGDGQTSTNRNPSHVYLAHGDYKVTLTARTVQEKYVFSTTVRVERDWSKQADRSIESRKAYARAVADYNLETLDLESLALAPGLFDRADMPAEMIRAAETLLFDREGAPEDMLFRVGTELVEKLREVNGRNRLAELALRLEPKLDDHGRRATMALTGAEALMALGRWDEAAAVLERVGKYKGLPPKTRRRLLMSRGDLARHRAEGEQAEDLYKRAADISIVNLDARKRAVRIGTLTRYVEEYMRQRKWEWVDKYLADWAWEFPREKLQGHWSHLKTRSLMARGRYEEVLAEARNLLAANPDSPYAVRLLIAAAEAQVALGRDRQARLLLETAVEDYPEDPQRDEARERLEALGGPVDAG